MFCSDYREESKDGEHKSSRVVAKYKGENIKERLCWHQPKAMCQNHFDSVLN